MADPFEIGVKRRVGGDHYSDSIDEALNQTKEAAADPLDSEESRRLHRKLMDWYFHERSRQSDNRMQMALDADFYDGLQWSPEDQAEVTRRGQMPLVFNEVAPMVDWLIGTERRTRIDWKVLPRAEDDVDSADAKTKVLKFVSDLNHVTFARSRAFSDAIKSGVGWLDDGARNDPSEDVLYSRYEDWRNVLWDSSSYDLDLSDARYIFRWRWVDADVAEMMFPKRSAQLRRAVVDADSMAEDGADEFYLGMPIVSSGSLYSSGGSVHGEASRRRIRLIECQFRQPTNSKIIASGPLKGSHYTEHDEALIQALETNPADIVERMMMRTHFAVFTEESMLSMGASIYRHNKFSLTPLWCYRNGRTRLPYGTVRRVRDIQQDLNKRASKALFMLSTNQIIADKGAVDDKNVAREEADMPDGYIEKNPNKEFTIRRDTDAASGQIQMMTLDAQTIQRAAGVNNENLGRQTNATSGEAIKARQIQGSVATTEPFDNHRLATQIQGEKMLSLVEQFYTEEKVVRLTGARGRMEWLKINQPEIQPDGSVRYINDITSSAADFVVSEQDYAGTLRQVMFDTMTEVAAKFPPELAVRFMRMAYEYSDMPNKDAIVDEIRKITGERDDNKPMTPEEAQQAEQQMRDQAEALQMQRESAALAMDEQKAKVDKLNAEVTEIMARAQGGDGMPPEMERVLRQVQEQAATKLESMAEQLRKVQMDAANKTMAINRDADVKLETARIDASSRERVAEIQGSAEKQMDALMSKLDAMSQSIAEANKQAQEATKAAEDAAKRAEQAEQMAKNTEKPIEKEVKVVDKEPAAPTNITVPITFEAGAFQVDAKSQQGNKTITLSTGTQTVTGSIKQENGKDDI